MRPRYTASPAPASVATWRLVPVNGAALLEEEVAELPAGAALDAMDAAAVELAIEAELPAEAAPLAIIEEAALEDAAIDEPSTEEAAIEETTAAEEVGALEEPPPPAATDMAQEHTAFAEVCTARPVVGPQVPRTHAKAALLIAALLAEPHWQMKSSTAQPT